MYHEAASRRPLRLAALLLTIVTGAAIPLQAQARLRLVDAHPGDCDVTIEYSGVEPGNRIGVDVEFTRYAGGASESSMGKLNIPLAEPLGPRYRLHVRLNGVPVAGDDETVPALKDGESIPVRVCRLAAAKVAAPPATLNVWAFFGSEVDNFSVDSSAKYPNNNKDDLSTQHTQTIFGIDFEFQAWHGLILAGESLHAVRTADIDCQSDNARFADVCSDGASVKKARYILTNASSLEVVLNPRYELLDFDLGTETPATLYATGRIGFTSTRGVPFLFKARSVGAGLTAKGGPFEGTYIEGTWGYNQLLSNEGNRYRFDSLLSFRLPATPWNVTSWFTERSRFFIEGVLDEGRGHQASSYRTFYGMDIDLRALSR